MGRQLSALSSVSPDRQADRQGDRQTDILVDGPCWTDRQTVSLIVLLLLLLSVCLLSGSNGHMQFAAQGVSQGLPAGVDGSARAASPKCCSWSGM